MNSVDFYRIEMKMTPYLRKPLTAVVNLANTPDVLPTIDFNDGGLYFLVIPDPTPNGVFDFTGPPQICRMEFDRQLLPEDERTLDEIISSLIYSQFKVFDIQPPSLCDKSAPHLRPGSSFYKACNWTFNEAIQLSTVEHRDYGSLIIGFDVATNVLVYTRIADKYKCRHYASLDILKQLSYTEENVRLPFERVVDQYTPNLITMRYQTENGMSYYFNATPTVYAGLLHSLPGLYHNFHWAPPLVIPHNDITHSDSWEMRTTTIPFLGKVLVDWNSALEIGLICGSVEDSIGMP